MSEAYARVDTQRVYRTHALGTIAELVVTDGGALIAAAGAAPAGARAHRPRRQQVQG